MHIKDVHTAFDYVYETEFDNNNKADGKTERLLLVEEEGCWWGKNNGLLKELLTNEQGSENPTVLGNTDFEYIILLQQCKKLVTYA